MTLDKDLANDLPRSNTGGPRQSGTSLTPPLSHAVPVAVPGERAPGDAVSTSSGQPGGEIGGESSGLESGVAGRGEPKSEPELMDLRLHAPTPEVVVVRVSARCRGAPPRVLAERVSQQPCRAPHVDVDLGQVSVPRPWGPNGAVHAAPAGHGAPDPVAHRRGRARGATPSTAQYRSDAAAALEVNGGRGDRGAARAAQPGAALSVLGRGLALAGKLSLNMTANLVESH
jgi:hypothetical protein